MCDAELVCSNVVIRASAHKRQVKGPEADRAACALPHCVTNDVFGRKGPTSRLRVSSLKGRVTCAGGQGGTQCLPPARDI